MVSIAIIRPHKKICIRDSDEFEFQANRINNLQNDYEEEEDDEYEENEEEEEEENKVENIYIVWEKIQILCKEILKDSDKISNSNLFSNQEKEILKCKINFYTKELNYYISISKTINSSS